MAIETERRFLLDGEGWRLQAAEPTLIRQGYLSLDRERVVRVRVVDGTRGWITVKGIRRHHRRHEFEYEIPVDQAVFMLDGLCLKPLIVKRRFRIENEPVGDWIVDEFCEANKGLVIAEIEYAEGEQVTCPPWVGREISTDDKYANSSLVDRPFAEWAEQ
ncbi:CYTH domain-containing protein [Catenulispora pinisilvae]|uniref:CYTH domain-containing protein n=1 Tax=Catenulispora pinisilvae TaxID=2705253 RepID=UPI001891EA9D|nr:CYTH domain-containing protein [Catenulispora pinisilvae]